MAREIVHLKYPVNSSDYKYRLTVMPRSQRQGFSNIAKHATACWTTINDGIKATTDKRKVTCKKCIRYMNVNLR